MFINHFNLTRHPFEEKLDEEMMLRDTRVEKALSRLDFLIKHGYFGIIFGRPGVGKTMLLRTFIDRLDPSEHTFIEMHNTNINGSTLLRSFVRELGEQPGRGRDKLYLQITSRLKSHDKTTILSIDNAELLDNTALTDLRLLAGLSPLYQKPFKILLCGLDDIESSLRQEKFADLNDRINIRVPLHPMDEMSTLSYIDHRLKKSGGSDKIIPLEVKVMIHQCSGGVLRKVNNITTSCLIAATVLNQSYVSERTFRQAVQDLGIL